MNFLSGNFDQNFDQGEYFVALCPPMDDRGGPSLNLQSWQQRGWCRAEAVLMDLSEKNLPLCTNFFRNEGFLEMFFCEVLKQKKSFHM